MASSAPTPDEIGKAAEAAPLTSPCVTCREPIRLGARKCIHCDSFQDWRGKLSLSTSVLAMVVALVSVVGATLPAWKAALTVHDSEVKIFFVGVSGLRLHVMMANSGDRPAGILKTWLLLKANNEYLTIASGGPSGEIHENVNVMVNVSTNEKFRPDQIQNARNGCVLGIEVISFRGKKTVFSMDVPADTCQEFLIHHQSLDWQH
jgi:hypothetical protein